MIGYISGIIKELDSNTLLIVNSGIGWQITTPNAYKYSLDEEISLYTYLHHKEDEMSLWGFSTKNELNLFKDLISVSGVGPKTGILIIQEKGMGGVVSAIMNNNPDALKVSGVGAKTSQKIIIELKTKIKKFENLVPAEELKVSASNLNIPKDVQKDAVDALISLGYRKEDIDTALSDLGANAEVTTSQSLIKLLLKNL